MKKSSLQLLCTKNRLRAKTIIFTFAMFGALIIVLPGCASDSAERQSAKMRNVVLTQVSPVSGDEGVSYPGMVEEGASVDAAFMADGKIGSIQVKEGDRVRKGQLLATLDDHDYRIGVAQLETQLAQMSKEKERMDAMFEKHNIAPNDYEKFQAGYEQLKLQLEMAKRQMSYTRLYSPTDGYVATRYLNPGELVGAGTPVFNIVDDSRLRATVDLPVSVYLDRNKIQSATGTVPGIPGNIPLKVVSFTPDADNNMLYRMKLSIPASVAKELSPGMNISVLLSSTDNTPGESLVPSRAIFSDSGQTYVWVYNASDSTIHRQKVTIEGAPEGKMSVVKGLNNGTDIVETGVRQLHEGEKVNVLNRNDLDL